MEETLFGDMKKDELEMFGMELQKLAQDEEGLKMMSEGKLEEFDKNENGVLELNEFTGLMQEMYASIGKGKISEEEIGKMFKEIDTNHDDTVDKEEFIPLCKKLTIMLLEQINAQIAKLS